MPDTAAATRCATCGAFRRLTPEAIARATQLADNDEDRARQLGISRRTYFRMRNGSTDTPLSIATRVAEVLGMSVDQAFGR